MHLSVTSISNTDVWIGEHIVDFFDIRSYTSAVTPIEKSSINANRKSTMCFPMSLRWSSYIAPKPPKGAPNSKTAVFGLKSHFAWKTFFYEF